VILITGANGTTGSEVVRQLVAAGRPVRALVRRRENAAALPQTGLAQPTLDYLGAVEPTNFHSVLSRMEESFQVIPPVDGAAADGAEIADPRHVPAYHPRRQTISETC